MMNLLFPNNLSAQSPGYQLLWLVIIIIGCYGMISTVAALCLLLAGYDLDSISSIDFSALSGNALLLAKWLQIASTIALFIVPAGVFSWIQGRNWAYLGMLRPMQLSPLLIALVISICSFPIIGWLAQVNMAIDLPPLFDEIETWMRDLEDEAKDMTIAFLRMNTPIDLLLNLIMVAVLPALGEEMLFRGCIQRLFYRLFTSPHVAIWVAAAIFSFIHFQFYGFIPRMAIGALLGYLYYFSGNLWYPIIGHFLNNGLQVVGIYLFPSELENVDSAGMESIPIYLPIAALLLIIFGFKHFKQFFLDKQIAADASVELINKEH